jgi:hypothetical protein
MTWTEIGALIGALTGLFTVLDRLAFRWPLCSITTTRTFSIDLECHNPSRYHIVITGIRVWPNVVAMPARNRYAEWSLQQRASALLP